MDTVGVYGDHPAVATDGTSIAIHLLRCSRDTVSLDVVSGLQRFPVQCADLLLCDGDWHRPWCRVGARPNLAESHHPGTIEGSDSDFSQRAMARHSLHRPACLPV